MNANILNLPENVDLTGIVILSNPLVMYRRDFAMKHLDCGIIITNNKHGDDSEIVAYAENMGYNRKLNLIFNKYLRNQGKYQYYVGVGSSEVNSIE